MTFAPTRAAVVHGFRVGVRPVPLAMTGILGLGLALRLWLFYGSFKVDPFAYRDSAASIARWQPTFDSEALGGLYFTQYIRLPLVLPAALFYRLFGPSDAAETAVPIVMSLGTCVVVYYLGKRAGGPLAGLMAAFLAAVFPGMVANSTEFLPDTPLVFFSALATLLFLGAIEDAAPGWRRGAAYFGAGAAWAMAFYARPTASALLIPFAILYVMACWPRRRPQWEVAGAAAGAGMVVAAANALLMSLGSEPLEDLRVITQEGRGHAPGALQYSDVDWTYLATFREHPMFWPFMLAAAAGVALAFAFRREGREPSRRLVALAVLAAGEWFYFEHLMRLPGLASWVKEARYAMPMLVPLFALAGVGLARWLQSPARTTAWVRPAYVAGLALFLVAASISSLRNDRTVALSQRVDGAAIEAARLVEREPQRPVFTWDDDFARYLSGHLGVMEATVYDRSHNRGRVRNRFDAAGRSLVEPGAFVVLPIAAESDLASKLRPDPGWERMATVGKTMALYRVPG